jgi:CSLREA domain-containing protein
MRMLLLSTLLLSHTLHAATFVVDSTSDTTLNACTAAPNDCSLRGAIALMSGPSDLRFNIPMTDPGCVAATGVCTIAITAQLPSVNAGSNAVLIDGYTQPGAAPNTLTPAQGGSNAQLKIVISGGGNTTIATGLSMFTPGTIRGLVINGFRRQFSQAISFPSGGLLEGCFIGTDVTGAVAVANEVGVLMGTGGRIGGLLPAQRNVISSNLQTGIDFFGDGHLILGNLIGTNAAGTAAIGNGLGVSYSGGNGVSPQIGSANVAGRNLISGNMRGIGVPSIVNGTRIFGNFIGTDITGLLPVGNTEIGVTLEPSPNSTQPVLLGGILAGEGNVIAFNGLNGVLLNGDRNSIRGNQFFGNRQLGIATRFVPLGGANRRLANDPNDADVGSNRGQNFPEISAFSSTASTATVSYRIDSATTNSTYPLRVEFFKADADEGKTFLFADSYTALEAQSVKTLINQPIPVGVTIGPDDVIVGTATDAADNTSEFSFQALSMVIDPPVPSACGGNLRIFCDAFESNPQRSLEVTVRATSAVFKPNGSIRVSDNRGASCTLDLVPDTALSSRGSCVLANSGAPGAITITAAHNTFSGAFGDVTTGGDASVSTNFTVLTN